MMGNAKKVIRWILPPCALFGALWISLALFHPATESKPFFTTTSPGNTYTVMLTGQKERPLFFTVEVHFNVLKSGQTFLLDKYLHSGDSEDLSFEVGYPNYHWITENVIQFYREDNFNDGKPDTLIIVNNTDQAIKYAKIETVDKFLIFDLQPGNEIKVLDSPRRGDAKWLGVEGEFYNGIKIGGNGVSLTPPKNSSGPYTYYIRITSNGATYEGPQ
jgi:hypothetical protein